MLKKTKGNRTDPRYCRSHLTSGTKQACFKAASFRRLSEEFVRSKEDRVSLEFYFYVFAFLLIILHLYFLFSSFCLQLTANISIRLYIQNAKNSTFCFQIALFASYISKLENNRYPRTYEFKTFNYIKCTLYTVLYTYS